MSVGPKDGWDKTLITAQVLGAVFTPIAVVVVGILVTSMLTETKRERELRVSEIDLALRTISGDLPSDLKVKIDLWAKNLLEARTDQGQNKIDLVSAKNNSEDICFKPTAILLEKAPKLPKLKLGDDLAKLLYDTSKEYKKVSLRYNALIDWLNVTCGYLNKSPEQLREEFERMPTRVSD